MELRQLRYFVAVARRRHFTAAAEEIGVAQPALSQQIKLLERELGLDLFDRTGRRVRLTAAGEALLVRAERILADVASAEQEMAEFAGLARGRVIVGTLPSLAERQLPGLLAGFHARHPGLDLVLREESTVRLLALAGSGDVDLALINELPAADLPAGITTEPLFSEELVAVVAPAHRLAHCAALALADLRDEPFILSNPGSVIRRTVLAACAAAGFTPHVAFESRGSATVRALAAAGLGVAVLPRSEVTAAGPPIALVALTAPPLQRTVALAWSVERHQSAATAAFLAFARAAAWEAPSS